MAEQDTLQTLKQNLIEYVQLQLGGEIIDLELDPAHYESAYQRTLGVYLHTAARSDISAPVFSSNIW